MIRNQNSRTDDSVVNAILKELSPCCEATYAELLSKLTCQSSFKQLRELGEQQFFNATESTEVKEEEYKMIKMHYPKVSQLVESADNYINAIITEKFKGDFLIVLKEQVLKIILNLYSEQDSSVPDKSTNKQSSQVDGNSKDCAQKVKDSSKQVIDMPFEKTGVSKNAEELLSMKKESTKKIDDDNSDLGNISFDSLSSVHTSDLSSFDDEISISSDEEIGIKRKRLSIKKVEEEFDELRTKKNKLENTEEKQKRTKELKRQSSSDDSSFQQQQKSLPQRTRKPNSKYSEFNLSLSPIRTPNTAKATQNKTLTPIQDSDARNSFPRKRGRPRKIM